jgi:hypothetical protein
MASFVLISAMGIKLIIAIESLATEATFRVSLEATLVDCTRLVISLLLMFPQFCRCKKSVFVCKDLFIPGAQVTVGS